jgi:hypothetical protein
MEEILASIRKIIAEDTNEETPRPQEAQVLELTQEVHDTPAPDQLTSAPVPEEVSAPHAPAQQPAVMDADAAAEQNVSAESETSTPANEDTEMSSAAQTISHDGIFSDRARQAIDNAFASLDEVSQPRQAQAPRAPSFQPVEGNSIEAVFERAIRASVDPVLDQWMSQHQGDLLNAVKPMLRDWMDEHFPALLEGAVRDEVARVIRARGGR